MFAELTPADQAAVEALPPDRRCWSSGAGRTRGSRFLLDTDEVTTAGRHPTATSSSTT